MIKKKRIYKQAKGSFKHYRTRTYEMFLNVLHYKINKCETSYVLSLHICRMMKMRETDTKKAKPASGTTGTGNSNLWH